MNISVISCAGSGKTTRIIKEALKNSSSKILITTYTDENTEIIFKKIIKEKGFIPENITIMPFFTFLLEHCIRPYQNFIYDKRIESLYFENPPANYRYIPEVNIKHYITNENLIYRDVASKFSIKVNSISHGLLIRRLEQIFDIIYIDELQDISGYDFEFIELLLNSKINIFLVGDNRQATYSTTNSNKNKKYKGSNILDKLKEWEKKNLIKLEYNNICYRCVPKICSFADCIYPDMEPMLSKNIIKTEHDGVFIISKEQVNNYIKLYNPQKLRYSKASNSEGLNFGKCKGQQYQRVIIYPTKAISKFLETGDLNVLSSKEKFYVAITRAEQSVAIIHDGPIKLNEYIEKFY